jgi:predicted metalloprotease
MFGGRESSNIEDQRGMGGRGMALGGGGIATLLLGLVIYMCGGDPSFLLNQLGGGGAPDQTQVEQTRRQSGGGGTGEQRNDAQRKFVSQVLGSTEDAWREILPQQARRQYEDPKLVLFTNQVNSACGAAGASTGPFYCPGDNKLYLDFSFFDELSTQFKAPGDFAQAYVIGHEVGHHVQNLVGTMQKVNALQQRTSQAQSNQLSVFLELQADCYAGVWANHAQKRGQLEVGDVEEALRAAAAVGDDAIQKRAQGYVVPESFTHGSSKERMTWFQKGFQAGDMRQCNTFASQ